jgi:hypothetical protein
MLVLEGVDTPFDDIQGVIREDDPDAGCESRRPTRARAGSGERDGLDERPVQL